jgi:hypothetical protein
MKIVGVAPTEFAITSVETHLKETGLYGQYEAQIHGAQGHVVMVCVHSTEEKEQVVEILQEAGVVEIMYKEDQLAASC